ncbi:MAG: hypothetical protein M3406_12975, partial [Chloroflexota bacterium]|nr:hypothetical protein [Chloroflexota bacterium]
GLFCFGPQLDGDPTSYKPMPVPAELSMDRVLYRACQDIVALAQKPPLVPAPEAEGLAVAAKETAEEAADEG